MLRGVEGWINGLFLFGRWLKLGIPLAWLHFKWFLNHKWIQPLNHGHPSIHSDHIFIFCPISNFSFNLETQMCVQVLPVLLLIGFPEYYLDASCVPRQSVVELKLQWQWTSLLTSPWKYEQEVPPRGPLPHKTVWMRCFKHSWDWIYSSSLFTHALQSHSPVIQPSPRHLTQFSNGQATRVISPSLRVHSVTWHFSK